jgi:hypothetical protein
MKRSRTRQVFGYLTIEFPEVYLWSDFLQLVTRPFAALPLIERRRRQRDGLLALGIGLILPLLAAELAGIGPFRPPAELGSLPEEARILADIFARWSYQHRFLLPLLQLVAALALWVAAGGLIHLFARNLDGRGGFGGYLKLVGYVALAGSITLPLLLLDCLFRAGGNARAAARTGSLLSALALAVFVWQNFLLIVAAHVHYGISGGRATTAVIGPVGCLALLIVALVVAASVLLVLMARVNA